MYSIMASKSLRSRVVETNAETASLVARERESEGVDSVDRRGSAGLQSEGEMTTSQGVEGNLTEQGMQPRVLQLAVNEGSDIKQMLAGLIEVMQQSQENNVKLLENFKSEIQNNVKSEIQSVKAELAASQESIKVQISSIKEEIKIEDQKLRKEFDGKLDSETRRVTKIVNKMQNEAEAELVAVKGQLQTINSECQAQVGEVRKVTQNLVQELTNHLEKHRTEVDQSIQKLGDEINQRLTQQKESVDQASTQERTEFNRELSQVTAKLIALENRVLDLPTSAVVIEPRNNSNSPNNASPSTGKQSIGINGPVQSNESRTCSCESENCDVCMVSNVNRCRVVASVEAHQVSSFLSSSELPLPLFNEDKDTNPVYYLRQLDQFLQFRGVPKAMQLAVAFRSVVGPMSSHWLETVSWNLQDYTQFKQVFLKPWWSTARQSLVLHDMEAERRDEKKMRYNLEIYEKITGFNFTPDGREIVMAGVSNGASDIYRFNLVAGTFKQITSDLYDDFNPTVSSGTGENDGTIIF